MINPGTHSVSLYQRGKRKPLRSVPTESKGLLGQRADVRDDFFGLAAGVLREGDGHADGGDVATMGAEVLPGGARGIVLTHSCLRLAMKGTFRPQSCRAPLASSYFGYRFKV